MNTQLKELVAQLKLLGWEFPLVINGYRYRLLTQNTFSSNGLFRRPAATWELERVPPTAYPKLLEEVIKQMEGKSNGQR